MPTQDDGFAGYTFSFGERLGLVFIVESAGLSTLAVLSLLIYISYYAIRPGRSRTWTGSTHIHYYFVNLLLCDLMQALGGLLNIRWVVEAKVTEDGVCTTQGVIKQIGDVGVALTSLTIALHTFFTLVIRWNSNPKFALIIVALIWIFLALITGVGVATHNGTDYYGNTQYWCWITEKYAGERIGLEYLWMFIAAIGNVICYIFIALVIKGVIVFEHMRFRRRRPEDENNMKFIPTGDGNQGRASAVARQMLFYPAVYLVTVTPIAIVRWWSFSGANVPFQATCFASILFSASGLFHVILFAWTRPRLLPTRDPTRHGTTLPAVTQVLPLQTKLQWADDDEVVDWKGGRRLSDPEAPLVPPKDWS